jgi:hypothetical protein
MRGYEILHTTAATLEIFPESVRQKIMQNKQILHIAALADGAYNIISTFYDMHVSIHT